MGKTPDKFPGPREEEELILEAQGSDPTTAGAIRYRDTGSFAMKDATGVFNPRSAGGSSPWTDGGTYVYPTDSEAVAAGCAAMVGSEKLRVGGNISISGTALTIEEGAAAFAILHTTDTTAAAGILTISAQSSSAGAGGALDLNAGDSSGGGGAGGAINIYAGDGNGAGAGGFVTLRGGDGTPDGGIRLDGLTTTFRNQSGATTICTLDTSTGDLTWDAGVTTPTITQTATSSTAGQTFSISAQSSSVGTGGDLTLNAGDATGGTNVGGDVNISAGDGSSSTGGSINLTTGDGSSDGNIYLNGAATLIGNQAGDWVWQFTASSGDITIHADAATPYFTQNSRISGTGNTMTIRAQSTTGTTDTGGALQLISGTGGSSGWPGDVRIYNGATLHSTLKANSSTDVEVAFYKGFVSRLENQTNNSGAGGDMYVQAGTSTNVTSAGGNLYLRSGQAGAGGTDGKVYAQVNTSQSLVAGTNIIHSFTAMNYAVTVTSYAVIGPLNYINYDNTPSTGRAVYFEGVFKAYSGGTLYVILYDLTHSSAVSGSTVSTSTTGWQEFSTTINLPAGSNIYGVYAKADAGAIGGAVSGTRVRMVW